MKKKFSQKTTHYSRLVHDNLVVALKNKTLPLWQKKSFDFFCNSPEAYKMC